MFKHFYAGKKVLITGHTGFKGSWLAIWLMKLGAEVIGYSLPPPTVPSHFEACRLSARMNNVEGDIRNLDSLIEVLLKYKPDFLFHCAAQAIVRSSYEDPKLTFETNFMGTVNVLEAIRRVSTLRACIIVTSDKCYASHPLSIDSPHPSITSLHPSSIASPSLSIASPHTSYAYKETDPMGGDDPYSASKGCAELVTAAYIKSFFQPNNYDRHGVAVASVRAGNVIGGGDWGKDRLIPDCIKAFSENKPVILRYPHAVRPWQHVLEPIYGYLLLGLRLYKDGPYYTGGWNFGPSEAVRPVQWVVEHVAKLWGNNTCWILDPNAQPQEASYLFLDSTKAHSHLGWSPQWHLEESLEKTVLWYKEFACPKDRLNLQNDMLTPQKDVLTLSLSQILEYETSMCRGESTCNAV